MKKCMLVNHSALASSAQFVPDEASAEVFLAAGRQRHRSAAMMFYLLCKSGDW
jgi:hypothetical protein